MEKYQKGVILVLLCLSALAIVVPALIFCLRRVVKKPPCGRTKRLSGILEFSACLVGAVWCLRYAVGYFAIITAEKGTVTLTCWEEVFNSLVHALQTFSMDEDYTAYILNGKQMLGTVFGGNSLWKNVYGVYASLLNFIAPVAGGAILFEILASIFPRLRLSLLQLAFWKEKYYFSELNEASLALAKSICGIDIHPLKMPVIVFTDVYVDDEREKGSELLLAAKSLGAICMRDDLSHVRKNRFGRRSFFLIDVTEAGNLHTLAALAGSGNCACLKKSEIYFFTNDDAYVQVEQNIMAQLRAAGLKDEELPVFIPVKSDRNLISNLLVDLPLYEPLIGKKKNCHGEQTLTVSILGTGHIGTEMFLSTYWIGQILNCKLEINVVSQESEEKFWSKIDYVNPEIRHTTEEGDPILRVNSKGDPGQVYCKVRYLHCDVKSSTFISCLTEPGKGILDTDYFLVSLGSDGENISVANTLRRYIGQYHLKTKERIRTVITYVVYDPELAQTLNQTRFYSSDRRTADVYMRAIGSLYEVYSVRNICMTDYKPFAEETHAAYVELQNRKDRAKAHRKRLADDYTYWANMAKVMHLKYKIYSMGLLTVSVFDNPNDEAAYRAKLAQGYEIYQNIASGQIDLKTPEEEAGHLELLHKIAWLEHRRWNAFTRVKGFRSTTDYGIYGEPGVEKSYKQMELKLHPCLVECDQKGIRASISAKGIIDKNSILQGQGRTDFDLLDDLSYDLYEKKLNFADFKQYDYPTYKS